MKRLGLWIGGALGVSTLMALASPPPEDGGQFALSSCLTATTFMASVTAAGAMYFLGRVHEVSGRLFESISLSRSVVGLALPNARLRAAIDQRMNGVSSQLIENLLFSFGLVGVNLIVPYLLKSSIWHNVWPDDVWFTRAGVASGIAAACVFFSGFATIDTALVIKLSARVDSISLLQNQQPKVVAERKSRSKNQGGRARS